MIFISTCLNLKEALPMDKLITLNMCDFCAREVETCGAKMIRSIELNAYQSNLKDPDSVVACDKYKSPVEILKKKFH